MSPYLAEKINVSEHILKNVRAANEPNSQRFNSQCFNPMLYNIEVSVHADAFALIKHSYKF